MDSQLLLLLNGSDSVFLDNCFLLVTRTATWLPLLAVLLLIILFNSMRKISKGVLLFILFAVAFSLVIVVCDQTASNICKPLFARLRPSHEPALLGLVDLVNGRRGSTFGFFSSHAANSFGVATFSALVLRHRLAGTILFLWAALTSYSRIYLGLHYPGDILVGLLFGLLVGFLFHYLYRKSAARVVNDSAVSIAFSGKQALLLAAAFALSLIAIALRAYAVS